MRIFKITNIILIVSTFLFISCEKKTYNFKINGMFENRPDEQVVLYEMKLNDMIPVDSAISGEHGEFVLTGMADHPGFFAIGLNSERNNHLTLIVHPGDKISVTLHEENPMKNYSIDGSFDSELVREMVKKLDYSFNSIRSLGLTYEDSLGSPNILSIRDELNQKYDIIANEHREFTRNFIVDNNNSLACLMALYQHFPKEPVLSPQQDMHYFKLVDSSLSVLYPKSEPVKALRAQMIEIKEDLKRREALERSLGMGTIAPEIALPTPDGDTIALSTLRGNYVLLDFWAAWCGPCRRENPYLVASYDKYNEKGFEIYQVSLDRTRDAWLRGIKEDGLNWTHVSDLKYWSSVVVPVYNIRAIPANFLLDKEGKIIAKDLRGTELDKKLEDIFSNK